MCIDLMGTLVTREEIDDKKCLKSEDYILFQNTQARNEVCCRKKRLKIACYCNKTLYRIKPYAREFLESTKQFFEMICYSDLSSGETELILKHLERNRKKKFHMVIFETNVRFPLQYSNQWVFNILEMLVNRKPQSVFFMSRNVNNLCVAMISGCCIVPIPASQGSLEYELQLAENYLMANRSSPNPFLKNQEDFK